MTVSTARSPKPAACCTARSPKPAACCTTPVATRFTRATGDCDLRRERPRLLALFRAPPLRPEERLLDFLEADLRPPLLRVEDFLPPLRRRDDFLAEDLRALAARFLPPLLRPEGRDRDFCRPPLRRLDFLAAAIGKLRVGGSVEPIARFARNKA